MTIKKRRILKTKRRLPKLKLGGDPTSISNLASIFGSLNGISTTDPNKLRPTNNPGGKSGGGLNMSFDPISMGLSTLTAIGGALGANMAAEKAEMYDDASDNLQMIDVNKATKGSGLQSFLQNPLSLGIGGRKKAKIEAEEFNENMAKQLRNRNVASRFSTMSDAPTYTPVARQGGFIAYKGQTHEGPDGGILVDKFGNPTAISQEDSVASVEGGGKHKKGEVSYYDPESGSTYIYSDSLKFAKPANSILNKYKLTKPESLQYQQYKNDLLTQTMVKKKFENLTTAQEFAKENKMKAKDAINMFEKGGTLPTKRKVLMPKENMEYDRDLRMNQDWMGSLKQAKDLDSMYATPVGTWKGNPMSLQQFTEMPEYVTNYYKPNYAIEFNKNRLGLPNTFQDINLGKVKQDPSLPRYQPASTITPGNEVAYYKKGGYVPMYEKGKKPKKSYNERSTGFIEDANEFIFDPVSAIMGLPSTKNIKGIGYDFIPGVGGATFGLRTFGKAKEYPKVPTPQAVAPYEVPNLEINPTVLPGQLPNAPTLDMSSGFANVSGLYDKKTNNAGPGYYNQGFRRIYDFGNMEPQAKTPINTVTSNGIGIGKPTKKTSFEYRPDINNIGINSVPLADLVSGQVKQKLAGKPTWGTPSEDEYGNSWLNPAGHMLSAAGAIADYAAMKKARPEDVSLGRVGAERISLARQRLANTRNTASARAMASSAARSSGMNAGVALSNTLAANTGANRLLGQQNAELLEKEEATNAQMRQQANMVNAELAAQEGLFNTQQQNAYRMMMAQNNPLGNMARTAASYFADNAAYQQGYDTLQMLAPNAELYRDPNAKWKKNPFARPKVRLR